MNKVREYVENFDDEEKMLLINGWEEFERKGGIEDGPLRLHTEFFMKELGIKGDAQFFLWMERIAFEAYRYFARKYING